MSQIKLNKPMSAENAQNKIVNVHGVQFDISSILNDVTASIQNNIQKSLDGALKDYELYKSTHDAILQIPFVRDLYIQNQELISQLDQPIQLKIDEILPPTSPPVMHSYIQMFDSLNHNDPNKKNKKLSEEDESTSTIQSECSSESDSEEAEESESSEEEAEEAEEEAEEEVEEEQEEAEQEEAEQEEVEQEEAEEEQEEAEQEEAEQEEVEQEEEEEQEEAEQEEQEEEQEEQEEEQEEQEEEEQEEEEQEEQEEQEEEQEEEEEAEEEAEEEVYEIVIKNVTYFTTNENDGDIYSCVGGDVGEVVGKFKNKKPVFARSK